MSTKSETFPVGETQTKPHDLTPAPGVADGSASATGAPGVGLKWDDLSAIGIVAGELQWCIKRSIFEIGRFELWGYFGGRWCKWKDTFESVAAAKAHVATLSEGGK